MNEFALVVQSVGVRAGSQIAWLVQVQILLVIDEGKYSDVKLAALIQQRSLDILLDDEVLSLLLAAEKCKQLLVRGDELDASSPVLVFGLENPQILCQLLGG